MNVLFYLLHKVGIKMNWLKIQVCVDIILTKDLCSDVFVVMNFRQLLFMRGRSHNWEN